MRVWAWSRSVGGAGRAFEHHDYSFWTEGSVKIAKFSAVQLGADRVADDDVSQRSQMMMSRLFVLDRKECQDREILGGTTRRCWGTSRFCVLDRRDCQEQGMEALREKQGHHGGKKEKQGKEQTITKTQ